MALSLAAGVITVSAQQLQLINPNLLGSLDLTLTDTAATPLEILLGELLFVGDEKALLSCCVISCEDQMHTLKTKLECIHS